MATTLKRIDAREFDKLAEKTNLGPEAREMARLVLVDGKRMTEAAEVCGTYKQRVMLAVTSIRRVHQAASTRSGWVSLSMEIPERLAAQLGEVLAAMKSSTSHSSKALALSQLEHAFQKARQTLQGGDEGPE